MTLRLESNAQAPRFSRARLSSVKENLGDRYEDVMILVSELVANSVRHSKSDGPLSLTVETTDDTIRLEVWDSGPCFDPKTAIQGDGFGLEILDRLSSRWGVDNGNGCMVWAELAMSRTSERVG